MYYETDKDDHGLPFSPFKSCVVPRPIGWISTRSKDGVDNLAPYSQFQNLTFDPPYVMIGINQTVDGKRKDTTVNIEDTGEFVYNMVTYDLRDAMNRTAVQEPPEVDEFEAAGLHKAPSKLVNVPRVEESPIQFECVYHSSLRLPGRSPVGTIDIIIGRVVAVHIKDEVIRPDGKLDMDKLRPLARMGYSDYTSVEHTFELIIPAENKEEIMSGLSGASSIDKNSTFRK